MPVEKERMRQLSLNFSEEQWRIALILDKFDSEPLDTQSLNPFKYVSGSLLQFAIGTPLGIISAGEVIDADVLDEGGDD